MVSFLFIGFSHKPLFMRFGKKKKIIPKQLLTKPTPNHNQYPLLTHQYLTIARFSFLITALNFSSIKRNIFDHFVQFGLEVYAPLDPNSSFI